MANEYSISRQYYTLLLFHDHSFWDLKDNNGWELYGEYMFTSSTDPNDHIYDRRDNITHEEPWFAARCDLEKSKYDLVEEEVLSTNNSFSSIAPGGYLYHRNPITVSGPFSSMCCWFKIRECDALEFYGSDSYHVTLFDWDNENGTHIHIEIRARDDNDKLTECIKVYYDDKLYQVNYPEPILNDTWYYFSYAVNSKTDAFYINGRKILEVNNNRSTQPDMEYKKIKIGAHDMFSSGGLNIDEFIIVNDYITNSEGFLGGHISNIPIIWIRPEMFELDDLNDERNLYYQYGSALKLNYVLYRPSRIEPPYLYFEKTQGIPLGLFAYQSKLSETSWEGNIKKIKILDPTVVSTMKSTIFTLATVVKFIPDNMREYINGCSLYDHILHPIRITRISYWTEPEDGAVNMFNKIKWYQNNKIPMSDFRYFNRFHPEKKQWT